ncbi:MAG: FKBP-type peptidyl-prolyl cis-trans isomerase [Saprospiraceae bacterium]
MKFLKLILIVAIVAPMFLTSCGDKQEDGEYSLSFDVPDSVAYQYGIYHATSRLQGIQSLDLDEFSKGVKKGFSLSKENRAEFDTANVRIQTFGKAYQMEEMAKKQADTSYISGPIDLPSDISYNLGVITGFELIDDPLNKMSLDEYLKGVKDYFTDKSNFNQDIVVRVLQGYFNETDSLRIIVNEQFLVDNKEEKGVITTPSGLQYKVLTEGEGEKPNPENQVKVHYKGTFVDGKTFDSSYDRGEPITFPLNGVIKGWTEGVGLMSVGSKYEFVIPSDIGYGDQGNQNIPPKSTLVFEVELLEILPPAPQQQPQLPNPNNMTEEEMKKMIEEAQKNSK